MANINFNTNGGTKGSTGGGGSSVMATPIILTVTTGGTTITDALLGGVVANKVTSITRSGIYINLVSGAPAVGQCAINTATDTLTVNVAEPLVPTEVITINQLA